MNRQRLVWFLAMAALTLLAAASAPAFPATEGPSAEQAEADAQAKSSQAVETILKEQEQLMRGQRFSYDPQGRRDPFASLATPEIQITGPRPRGVAGMLVSEIDLAGIVEDGSGGDIAFFTGSDNKGYFLRVGDHVYDGTLIAIDRRSGSVTFRQAVDDPRQIKPYRDAVKRLAPLYEESTDE